MASAKSVPELLLASLEELSTEEHRTFQWFLTQDVLDDFSPLSKSQLENQNRQDTVDKMTNTYSHKGAVKVSVAILRKMKLNYLAEKLHRDSQTSCPVCNDMLRDPVTLSCSHRVCPACIHECWNLPGSRQCPVCNNRFSMGAEKSEGLCSHHGEKFKLFCLDDKQLICVVCQTSRKHKTHNCSPIDEVAQDQKDELQSTLNSLKGKFRVLSEINQNCAKHISIQAQLTESQIKVQFEKLHQFLQEEEAARIAELREEEQQKSQAMKEKIEEMSRVISSFTDTIRTLEEDLKAEDISFLQNYESTMERAQCKLPERMLVSGVLIDVAKHLGNLQFSVLEKMHDIVKYTPVILNPNTSQPLLLLSEDLTSVKQYDKGSDVYNDETLHLPDNPERFDTLKMVLGSKGFRSGTHSWDFKVGENTHWSLGVMTESAQRKGNVESGCWQYGFIDGKYKTQCPSGSDTLITVRQKPLRVRVQLDCDGGKLSFSDPDNKTLLHTYTNTEEVFPFCLNGCKHHSLSILPVKASVTVEMANEIFLKATSVTSNPVMNKNSYIGYSDDDLEDFYEENYDSDERDEEDAFDEMEEDDDFIEDEDLYQSEEEGLLTM